MKRNRLGKNILIAEFMDFNYELWDNKPYMAWEHDFVVIPVNELDYHKNLDSLIGVFETIGEKTDVLELEHGILELIQKAINLKDVKTTFKLIYKVIESNEKIINN